MRTPSPRHSKTNLDFESALRADGTVQLREGPDVATLGIVDSTPTPSPQRPQQHPVNTLVVVPPTPEARSQAASGSTAAVSSSPRGGDAEPDELELQNKRRSMFRSPGSASSPDLATLLRKAKENGGVVPGSGAVAGAGAVGGAQRQAQEETGLMPSDSFLSPNQSSPRLRGSSSTSSFSLVSAPSTAQAPRTPVKESAVEPTGRPSLSGRGTDSGTSLAASKPEWSLTSPRARSGSKVRWHGF